MKSPLILLFLFGCFAVSSSFAQILSSQNGNWNDGSTWVGGNVPLVTDQVVILASHKVIIPNATVATASQLTVNGILENQGGTIAIASIIFSGSSEYQHNVNGGTIPSATWQTNSTCRIKGITGATSIANINQPFYHFIWDCASQTMGNFFLQGNITTINGDLSIENTGGIRALTLGFNSLLTGSLLIKGNLLIKNTSRLSITSSGTYSVTVEKNLIISAISGAANFYNLQLNSSGALATLNVEGNFSMGSSGKLNMVLATGAVTNLNVKGNFSFTGGSIVKDPSSSDAVVANIRFNGSSTQLYTGGGTFGGKSIRYIVESGATLDVGAFPLGATADSFTSNGIVRLGSTDPSEAILDNIRPATRIFNVGSTVIYSGTAAQFAGAAHPSSNGVNTRIENSSDVTLTGDFTIGGDLILATGNVIVQNNIITLGGNLLSPNGKTIVVSTGSSISINGTGAFGSLLLSGSSDINNFTISRPSGSVQLNASLSITGGLTQTNGDIILNGTSTLTLNGPVSRTSGSIISNANASLIIQGTGTLPAMSSFSGNFQTFNLNRDLATLTTSSPFSIHNLILQKGSLANTNALEINAGGSIQRSAGNIAASPAGMGMYDLLYSNTVNIATGNEVSGDPNRINNFTLSGSANVTVSNTLSINGNLHLNTSGLIALNNQISLAGNLQADVSGDFSSSIFIFKGNTTLSGASLPTFGTIQVNAGSVLALPSGLLNVNGDIFFINGSIINANSGTVNLTGSSLQTLQGGGAILYNLSLDKPGNSDAQVTSALSIARELAIQSANTNLNSNGFIRLLSTSDAGGTGDAWIGTLLNGATVSGEVHVERFMSNEGKIYRYISSSVGDASVDELNDDFPITGPFTGSSVCATCGSIPSMYFFNNLINDYTRFPTSAISETMEVGRGYASYIFQSNLSGPVTIDYFGELNQGNIILPVSFNSNVPTDSWNLVGNPYPATIDWDEVSGWVKGPNIGTTIAVRDNGSGGVFKYWDGLTGGLTNGLIAKGQAFWVLTDGPDINLEINESAKSTLSSGVFYRSESLNGLILKLKKGTLEDHAYIRTREGASLALDKHDAPKLNNEAFDISTLSIGKNPTALAINALTRLDCASSIFIKTADMTEGTYTLSNELFGSAKERKWILKDNFTNTVQSFEDPYTFTVNSVAASKATNRFELLVDVVLPDLALKVNSDKALICEEGVTVTIPNAQTQYRYQIEINEEYKSDLYPGVNGLAINLKSGWLKEGANQLRVIVEGSCQNYLYNELIINKVGLEEAKPMRDTVCSKGVVVLKNEINPHARGYKWYASADGGVPIIESSTFTTAVLENSTVYYSAAINSAGCEGPRIAVIATVIRPDEITIAVIEDEALQSSFSKGNQWFYNNQRIEGATAQIVKAVQSGVYRVENTSKGCAVSAQIEFVNTGTEEGLTEIHVYPNPVENELHIDLPQEVRPVDIQLLSTDGKMVKKINADYNTVVIATDKLTPGLYLLIITSEKGSKVFRISKH